MAISLNMVPTSRLIRTLAVIGTLSLCLAVISDVWLTAVAVGQLQLLLVAAAGFVGAWALADYGISRRYLDVRLQRQLPATVAVDRYFTASLTAHHTCPWPLAVTLFEQQPRGLVCKALPLHIKLKPGVSSSLDYRMKATVRGDLHFTACVIHIPSRWRLWRFDRAVQLPDTVRVYPDFSAIAAYSVLAMDNHTSQVGIRKKPRRGEGTDFHQLREYRQGDSLRQVDWKATSRKQKIVSRDYTDERDQEVVLLLDTGRRMRAKDHALSHFDHCLNALLLVSYVALRQGDSVSVLTFGSENRWIPRQKGPGQVQAILNAVYDLDAGRAAPDYISAAQRLARVQQKRALVILASNCRDEDVDDLSLALQLLRKRHVVLLANLRETALDERLGNEVQSFDEALEYAGAKHYLASRATVQQHLRSQGAFVLDATPQNLAAQLANAYLEIKSAGLL